MLEDYNIPQKDTDNLINYIIDDSFSELEKDVCKFVNRNGKLFIKENLTIFNSIVYEIKHFKYIIYLYDNTIEIPMFFISEKKKSFPFKNEIIIKVNPSEKNLLKKYYRKMKISNID